MSFSYRHVLENTGSRGTRIVKHKSENYKSSKNNSWEGVLRCHVRIEALFTRTTFRSEDILSEKPELSPPVFKTEYRRDAVEVGCLYGKVIFELTTKQVAEM